MSRRKIQICRSIIWMTKALRDVFYYIFSIRPSYKKFGIWNHVDLVVSDTFYAHSHDLTQKKGKWVLLHLIYKHKYISEKITEDKCLIHQNLNIRTFQGNSKQKRQTVEVLFLAMNIIGMEISGGETQSMAISSQAGG